MHVTPRAFRRSISSYSRSRLDLTQAARRLVEDDDARAAADRGRDLHHLLLRDRSARRPRARTSSVGADLGEHRVARAARSPRDRRSRARAGSAPRQRFSATDRFSQNASSWCTMPTPAASASRGLAKRTLLAVHEEPSAVRRVDAGEDLPERALARRRSRRRARGTSRRRSSSETSLSACTPGKRLVTFSNRTAAVTSGAAATSARCDVRAPSLRS